LSTVPSYDVASISYLRPYRTGELGGAREQSTAASIVRVVIAGGSLPEMEVPSGSLDPKQQSMVERPLRDLDLLLTQLAAALPVDLMPGAGDPTNHALPQQPLHPCMFTEAARYTVGRGRGARTLMSWYLLHHT